MLRTYLAPILLSVGLLLLSPLGLLVILLSGDSCCGEDTTATMAGVAAGIVATICLVAWGLAAALAGPSRRPAYRRSVACAVMATPVSLVHLGFVAYVSLTAF